MAAPGALGVAVDSEGYMYTYGSVVTGPLKLVRFTPAASGYDPANEEIAYEPDATTVLTEQPGFSFRSGLAIGRNDHLFVDFRDHINEYGNAAEGNPLLDSTIGAGDLHESAWITVDRRNGDIYASDSVKAFAAATVKVFDGETAGNPLKRTISGFDANQGLVSAAVDEATGHVFVDDINSDKARKRIYEFPQAAGNQTVAADSIATLEHGFNYVAFPRIAISNAPGSANQGYLYVPIGGETPGHLYAFEPIPPIEPPSVGALSVSDVTASEAEVHATINPGAAATSYAFEIAPTSVVEQEGFATAVSFGGGSLVASTEDSRVAAPTGGLLPGTPYTVRVVASNECHPTTEPGVLCSAEAQSTFVTLEEPTPAGGCPNGALRTGASAALPDCRAYELVTPPDTGARAPTGIGFVGDLFATREVSADGQSVSFLTMGGIVPRTEGAGGQSGDVYRAARGPAGWHTALAGPTGAQTIGSSPGGVSADHLHLFWKVAGNDPLASINGQETRYVRYPDGHSTLVGRGSIGEDQNAAGLWIAAGGTHILFSSTVRLEPNAPGGAAVLYDRTADEATHVVSLLPGDVPPPDGASASFAGTAADGSAVAFRIGASLYARFDNAATFQLGTGAGAFAGFAAGGTRAFYLNGGDLFAFTAATEQTQELTATGDVTVVNVARGGGVAYFTSPTALPVEPGPTGALPLAGQPNLYATDGTSTEFVGTVTARDVAGEPTQDRTVDGLGLWVRGVEERRGSVDPSQVTADGSVLVFSSRADLTAAGTGGKAEIYRYDRLRNSLDCLSCDPARLPAKAGASLVSLANVPFQPAPFSSFAEVANLSAGGDRVFFQTPEALVAADTDQLQDVYEWEANGVGSCARPEGCVFLISSGHSARANYLYGASATGDDVFFTTSDRLLGSDPDETSSIYDARVGGGFAADSLFPCQGEACRGQPSPAPALSAPASPASGAIGNVTRPRARKCPKGKHRVTRKGKQICVRSKRGQKRGHR
ncbi:MAG: hypothetical protein U0R71_09085 [Solirubrobacterales bacterium]